MDPTPNLNFRELVPFLGKLVPPLLTLYYSVRQLGALIKGAAGMHLLLYPNQNFFIWSNVLLLSLVAIVILFDEVYVRNEMRRILSAKRAGSGLVLFLSRVGLFATTLVSAYQVLLITISHISGYFLADEPTIDSSVKLLSFLLGAVALDLCFEQPRIRRKLLINQITEDGSVSYLTRHDEVMCRRSAVQELKDGDRLLLFTTQKLREGMRDDIAYMDKDFMEFWFSEINRRNLHLEQIVLVSSNVDLNDFILRVEKFKGCPNVRLGYILGHQSIFYADIFLVPHKELLLSFSDDSSQRNLATFGLRVVGFRSLDSFERLHNRVFAQEATWVKTFEGVDAEELAKLRRRCEAMEKAVSRSAILKEIQQWKA